MNRREFLRKLGIGALAVPLLPTVITRALRDRPPTDEAIYFQPTGNDQMLVFQLDSFTGLPVTPNGGDITIRHYEQQALT